MATTLLASRPGYVVAIEDTDVLPVKISLDDWNGFDSMISILTSIGIRTSGNTQFLHTLRNFIYVYSFGDRISDLVISGLAFNRSCTSIGPEPDPADPSVVSSPTDSGLERLLDYYDRNKTSHREQALSIAIGRRPALQGFLSELSVNLDDPATMVARFSLGIKYLPEGTR